MRGIPGWWFVLVLCVIFWAGYCVGTAAGCRHDEWVLSPARYWFLMQQLRQSPWAWTSPELQLALRDAQGEIRVLCAGGTAIASAYWYGGPQLALLALGRLSKYSSSLRAFSRMQEASLQGKMMKTTPPQTRKTIVVDVGNLSTAGSSAKQLGLETQPKAVD